MTDRRVRGEGVAAAAARRRGLAPLAFGFRPFFLLAGLAAAVLVPLWLLVWRGAAVPGGTLGAVAWHGHEMVFGYTVAVVAGFLLTAVSNWTGRPTATGPGLAGLAALWLLGRLGLLGEAAPGWLAAAVDVAFLPALALVVGVPLWRTRNRRNLAFAAVLLVLAALNLAVHLAVAGTVAWPPGRALWVAVDLIVLMMVVIGGRVIPSFTRNALPQARVRDVVWADNLAIRLTALTALVDLVLGPGAATGVAALAAGVANGVRLWHWGGGATLRSPILWILHLGYLWIAAGLVLRGAAGLTDAVPADAALHALTVGAIGTMTLGMMTRVALGHTGRPLRVAPAVTLAYLAVTAAALLRVAAPFAPGPAYAPLVVASGLSWSAAFLLFTVVYLPILIRPRADGRPG